MVLIVASGVTSELIASGKHRATGKVSALDAAPICPSTKLTIGPLHVHVHVVLLICFTSMQSTPVVPPQIGSPVLLPHIAVVIAMPNTASMSDTLPRGRTRKTPPDIRLSSSPRPETDTRPVSSRYASLVVRS